MTASETSAEAHRALEACIAISSALLLDDVATALCEAARDLTEAHYASFVALDVAGVATHRISVREVPDEEVGRDSGRLVGRRLIDELVTGRRALRLEAVTTNPSAVGLPPDATVTCAILAAPVGAPRQVHGNLYLAGKQDGREFTTDDERLVMLLAEQAAVALENARLLAASGRWLRELEALRDIGDALVSALDLDEMLRLICARARELSDAEVAQVFLPDPTGELLVAGDAVGDRVEAFRGLRTRIESSKVGAVFTRGRPARVDDAFDDPEIDRSVARRAGIRSCIYAPINVHEQTLGVIVCANKQSGDRLFTDSDLRMLELLADRAGVALHIHSRVEHDVFSAVREREERHRAIFESLDVGVVVIGKDRLPTDFNPAFARITGLSREELLGAHLDDPPLEVIDLQGKPMPPSEFAASLTFASGTGQRGVIAGICRRNGTVAWVRANAEPIYGEDDAAPTEVAVTLAEISDPRT